MYLSTIIFSRHWLTWNPTIPPFLIHTLKPFISDFLNLFPKYLFTKPIQRILLQRNPHPPRSAFLEPVTAFYRRLKINETACAPQDRDSLPRCQRLRLSSDSRNIKVSEISGKICQEIKCQNFQYNRAPVWPAVGIVKSVRVNKCHRRHLSV